MDLTRARELTAAADRRDRLADAEILEPLAVVDTFDDELLPDGDRRDVLDLFCHDVSTVAGPLWTLTDEPRVRAWARMLSRGGPAELRRIRAAVPGQDTATQRLIDSFIAGQWRPVQEWDAAELLVGLSVLRWSTGAVLRSGRHDVPTGPPAESIEGRLALLELVRPLRRLVEAGCVGRESELAQLHAHRDRSNGPGLLVVEGIGGVGKSTLMARFVLDVIEPEPTAEPPPGHRLWAYLDLDRPTLSPPTATRILQEIVRQVAAQHSDRGRLAISGELWLAVQERSGAGLESIDAELSLRPVVESFISELQLTESDELLVVLDTFEEGERGATPDWIDELGDLFAALAAGLPGFRLIVAGRSPATNLLPDRPMATLVVLPFTGSAAITALDFMVEQEGRRSGKPTALDPELGRQVVDLVGGLPLTLKLAARVLVHEGIDAVAGAAGRARTLDQVRSEMVRGFLYQRVLDHLVAVPPGMRAAVRDVARAGVVLRLITPELVREVLLPAVNRSADDADTLYRGMAAETGLVDELGDGLRLRPELRGPALAALRFDDAELVQRVHQGAARYYQRRPGEPAEIEAAYHRLGAGEPAAEVAARLTAEARRSMSGALAELPTAVAIEFTGLAAPEVPTATRQLEWEKRVASEVDAARRAGDLTRARELLAERPERAPGSPLHRLESRVAEAEGDLAAAVAAAERDLAACAEVGDAARYAAAAVRLALLVERSRRPADAAAWLDQAIAADVLAGWPELRLELLLNRIVLVERASLPEGEDGWLRELDARDLLRTVGELRVEKNTALVRLLAAAFGRDEPDRLQAAAVRVGLGTEEHPEQVTALARAVAEWDAASPDPGWLARDAGLPSTDEVGSAVTGTDVGALTERWTAGLAGLGAEAGSRLAVLWRAQPPEPVTEAMRLIYVWWKVVHPEPEPPPRATVRWWEDIPLDFTRPETRAAERLLLNAYPRQESLLYLAQNVGLNLARFDQSSSSRYLIRDVLTSARAADRLQALLSAVLDDDGVATIHQQLRELSGLPAPDRRSVAYGGTGRRSRRPRATAAGLTQVLSDNDLKQEFLDRFDELAHAVQLPGGGMRGQEGEPSRRSAEEMVDAMAKGTYQPDGSDLEAIVRRFTRPVHLIRGAGFYPPADSFPESETVSARLTGAAEQLGRVIPSSGRIELRNHRLAWVGTGWKVATDVVVTNRHVAEEFARQQDGGFAFRRSFNGRRIRASIDWRREYGERAESIFRVSRVLWIEPDGSADVALLEIEETGEDGQAQPPIIELMSEQEYRAAEVGRWLALIGYPSRDSHIEVSGEQRIFDGIYDVKRLAAGRVTALAGPDLLRHDAATLGGNSGSAVIDLDSGKAMALHFGGVHGTNSAVPAPRVAQILRARLG
jgi:hypothetical protein